MQSEAEESWPGLLRLEILKLEFGLKFQGLNLIWPKQELEYWVLSSLTMADDSITAGIGHRKLPVE